MTQDNTQMVAKTQWVRAIRPIRLNDGNTVVEGAEVQVSEAEAVEFCDKEISASIPFSGERGDKEWKKESIKRAVRIEAPKKK